MISNIKYPQLRIRYIIMSCFLVLYLVSCSNQPNKSSKEASVFVEVDKYLNGLGNKNFMGTILVAKGDSIVFEKAYGYSNLAHGIPNSIDSKYLIGSLTKYHTATAILLLKDQGKLELEDSICDYLIECSEAWNSISIHQLLNQTSGIVDLLRTPNFFDLITFPTTLDASIKRVREGELDFEPGSNFRYGNSGYLIAARIIELISKKSYSEFVKENIYEKLDMTNSGYAHHSKVIPNLSKGYSVNNEGDFENPIYMDMSIPIGAGSQYSTVRDLFKLQNALHSNVLITNSSSSKMFDSGKFGYGYGFYINSNDSTSVYEHMGDIFGYASYISEYPRNNLTIILLSNLQNSKIKDIKTEVFQLIQNSN